MIIIYNLESGLSIWEKVFDETMNKDTLLFSSFFSAIQNIVMEIVKSSSEEKALQELNLADKSVQITRVPKVKLEIITIADIKDRNHIITLHQKLTEILESHQALFMWDKWNGDVTQFTILDYEILEYVHQLFGTLSLTGLKDSQKQHLTKMWKDLPNLEQKMVDQCREEETRLRVQLKSALNLQEKRIILEGLDKCIQKLKDATAYEQIQKDLKRLHIEIEDTKKRAIYFLKLAKEKLNNILGRVDLDLKDVYLNLYSFSTKLKILGNKNAEQYKNMALQLIDKNLTNRSELITKILHLSEEIESYLPK